MGSANVSATLWFDGKGDGYGDGYPKDLSAAFRKLVEQERFEHGHGGYSGSFAEKGGDGVQLVRSTPVTEAEASAIANGSEADGWEGGRLNKLQKWGPCEAIPVVRTTPAKYKTLARRTTPVTLTAKDLTSEQAVHAAVAKAVGAVAGKATKPGQVEVVSIMRAYDKATLRQLPETVTKRATWTTGKDKMVTRYFLVGSGLRLPDNAQDWLAGYPTMAAARADAERRVNPFRGTVSGPVELEVVGVARRADGAPAASAIVKATQVSATFTVDTRQLETPAVHGTEHAGWYCYGWASS